MLKYSHTQLHTYTHSAALAHMPEYVKCLFLLVLSNPICPLLRTSLAILFAECLINFTHQLQYLDPVKLFPREWSDEVLSKQGTLLESRAGRIGDTEQKTTVNSSTVKG